MKTIHTRLRKIREDLGLSERALAQRLGEVGPDGWSVTHTTISNYEDGSTRSVPHEFLDAMVALSGYRMEWIVNGDLPRKKTKPDRNAIKLDVIGMVYNEEVDPLALKLFAEDAAGQGMGAAAAQARTAALERGAEPIDPEHEETDGPDGPDGSTDRSTDDGNGPPDTTRHAAP